MCIALNKNIIDIRKQIDSFSIVVEFDNINKKKGWIKSNKTLVFGSSRYALNDFAKSMESQIENVDELNMKYFFCIREKDFMDNKRFYDNIMFIRRNINSENMKLEEFIKDCEIIEELNNECGPIDHLAEIMIKSF